jgi:glycosyltransferase involved in cell wall biosynthesis
MRILMAHNHYVFPGGEDTVFAAEVELLRQQGHEVTTWVHHNRDLAAVPRVVAAAETIWSRSSQRQLAQILHDFRPDVAHFHNTFLAISPAAYYTCQGVGVPVVQTLHNFRLLCPAATFFRDGKICEDCMDGRGLWPSIQHGCWHSSRASTAVVAAMVATHRLLRTWHKQVDLFIALTNFARQKFIEGGLPAHKLIVKPNFVQPTSEVTRQDMPATFALFVGRLTSEKGLEVLLKAWQSSREIPLKIVGEGPLRLTLEQSIREFGLGHVELLGSKPHAEVLQLMDQAAFLVMPSTWYEGLPMTMIEAFSRRLPVIASNLGSMAEVIQSGQNGLLFNPNDAADLARTVAWAWEHPGELAALAANGYRHYETSYTPAANYQLLIDIYRRAILHSETTS